MSAKNGSTNHRRRAKLRPVRSHAAIDKLVTENMPLAYFMARKWEGYWGHNDSLSIAMEGLHAAALDWNKRIPFGSYASIRIRWAYSRAHNRMKRKKRGGGAIQISLDAPVDSDDPSGATLGDKIADTSAEATDLRTKMNDELDRLPGLMAHLNPRHRQVVLLRFGFDGEPQTLETIAAQMGVTRERIRQLEAEAIGALILLRRREEVVDQRERTDKSTYLERHPHAEHRALVRTPTALELQDPRPAPKTQPTIEERHTRRERAAKLFRLGLTDTRIARIVTATNKTIGRWRRELEAIEGPFPRKWRRAGVLIRLPLLHSPPGSGRAGSSVPSPSCSTRTGIGPGLSRRLLNKVG